MTDHVKTSELTGSRRWTLERRVDADGRTSEHIWFQSGNELRDRERVEVMAVSEHQEHVEGLMEDVNRAELDAIRFSEDLRALREAAQALVDAWDAFNDPKIRVGPVWPRMRDLRAVLGEKP